ncbi:hypothetical protein F4802DRAFT_575763 [Xylaria palmicola]|nr:hypothetical protein F4802DRAFT_575763 [Xylaria palmicola]
MVRGTTNAGVLALWLLAGHALSQTTTATSPAPTGSALGPSSSTFVSPSLHRGSNGGGLSENAKVGVSIGVTFAAIILVGATAIFCVIRRRNRALTNPQRRAADQGDVDEENAVVADGAGKGKEVYYMSPTTAAHHGAAASPHAPNGVIYQGGGYPIPGQPYGSPQQTYAAAYPTAQQSGETYTYSGMAYPATTSVVDPSQQHGYAGPSNTQYQSEAHLHSRQAQQAQQPGGEAGWTYPVSAQSPADALPAQDMQYQYLQDYQQQQQQQQQHPANPHSDQSPNQSGSSASTQGHQEDTYYVPPHPHASELPEQRNPVELMGEGHYKEAP